MDAEKPFRITLRLATALGALTAICTLAAMTTRIQMDVERLKAKTEQLETAAKASDALIREMHSDIKVLMIQQQSTQKQIEVFTEKLWQEK